MTSPVIASPDAKPAPDLRRLAAAALAAHRAALPPEALGLPLIENMLQQAADHLARAIGAAGDDPDLQAEVAERIAGIAFGAIRDQQNPED